MASRAAFVWMGFAGEGAWRSLSFLISWQNLPMQSCTVPGKHVQWSVPEQWLVVQLMNTGLHLLGINPPSDHLLTRGSGFLLIHIDAKQNYLHLNHWCFLESKCYEKVGPLARSLNESHSVGQRSCLSGWFVHSWTWEGPTANKNLALVMKCQCAALKLLALQLL